MSTTTLTRVNTPPAQTWNYLRANDITLTVPQSARTGDVRFALPRLFEAVECGMGEDVTAWVEQESRDSRYVEVRPTSAPADPILIDLTADEVADTGIMVRSGAHAHINVMALAGTTETTSAALVRIIVEAGAELELTELVAAEDGHTHLESVGITAAAGSRVLVRQFFLGAGTTAAGLTCTLAGTDARLELSCRYLGRGTDVLDVNHVVRAQGRRTRADILESGVLDGSATKALRATIDLVHGAKGAQGAELERVLVLSDDVTNKTMPTILCDEDDVAGNHGATIGSVGEDEIAYLATRGLTREEAEELYLKALFVEATDAAPTPEAQARIRAHAARVLGEEQAASIAEDVSLMHETFQEV